MKRVILLIIAALTFTGCQDFLEPEADSHLNATSFYSNEEEFELAVNGIYSQLQELYNAGSNSTANFWAMTEMRADNTSFQYNASNRGSFETEFLDEFMTQETDLDPENTWRILYAGILQCNTLLSRIEEVEFSSQERKDQFIGETKFIRAFFYFHLVRLFGDVPLVLEEVNSPQEAFSEGRTPKAQVYEQLISDVRDATVKLPPAYNGPDIGRATRGAAFTLLGEINMTLGNFQAAIDNFSEVIDADYSLMPNYADVFDPRLKNGPESIFDVQYNASIEGEASRYAYRFLPFNSGNSIIPFNDLNPGAAGFNIPTHDVIEAYEPGDLRKTASIGWFVQEGNSAFDVSLGDSIPYIQKFVHPFDQPGRTNENWPVYRFAHVLLMAAEAINEVAGPTGEARAYVDQVRIRAGLDEVDPGLNQEEFRQLIYREQRLELAFENHRWYQLVRTGRAVEVMNEHGKKEKALKQRLPPESFQVQEYMLLYPVPFREVRLNDFEQNPGW